MELEIILKDANSSDINGTELYDEIKSPIDLIKNIEKVSTPLEILEYLKVNNLMNTLPNIWVALRILLTMPVTVAACERNFSKLKLIKTYLRSTMSNERLNSLALLSIENEVVQRIDLSENIKKFADLKSRKIPLQYFFWFNILIY